jgi:glycerol kinase
MKRYVLALDQGTTSSRAVLIDPSFAVCGTEQKETTQYYPKPGWVEQDPMQIWNCQSEVIRVLLENKGIAAGQVAVIGITNQRETTVVWDRRTGKPVYPAIVWQDKRTTADCAKLIAAGHAETIRKKTGLVVDAYFSATKVAWILREVSGARERAENGELLFGTIDTWLMWNLSKGALHITDPSNASRTMLYNIEKGAWDEELLDIFGIPSSMLPEVRNSSEIYGNTDPSLFGGSIALGGIAGDQQAALFGQQCHSPGMAKNTYGTGCFMLMNTGQEKVMSSSGLLTTVAWGLNGKLSYALEGSVFIAGAAIQWLRDGLKMIGSARETESLCIEAGSNQGVYMVPAFAGLGAPYWDMDARGIICGLTQGVGVAHIVRATVESLAYQSRDVLDAMERDSGIALSALKVDGGACANNFLMQFQADLLGTEVHRPKMIESTAMGAGMLAGLAAGFWMPNDLAKGHQIDRIFKPLMSSPERESLYNEWKTAVARARI